MKDYSIKGTKLPTIPEGTKFKVLGWSKDVHDGWFSKDYTNFISYGSKTFNGEEFILAEVDNYWGTNPFMIRLKDIQKLDGMLERNREIIGYKLIKPKYKKTALDICQVSDFFNSDKCDFIINSFCYNRIKKAGVLDLWFEPVYKEKFTYKVGDYLYCIKDFIMESGEIRFTKGRVYLSEKDGCITNNNNKSHGMSTKSIYSNNTKLSDYFRLATLEEIEKPKKQKVKVGNIDLTIRDNKVYHNKTEDITNYVKQIKYIWEVTLNGGKMKLCNYDFIIDNITLSKTGCETKISSIKDWYEVAKKLK